MSLWPGSVRLWHCRVQYILPVFWMTSCLLIMGRLAYFSTWAESDVYDCLVWILRWFHLLSSTFMHEWLLMWQGAGRGIWAVEQSASDGAHTGAQVSVAAFSLQRPAAARHWHWCQKHCTSSFILHLCKSALMAVFQVNLFGWFPWFSLSLCCRTTTTATTFLRAFVWDYPDESVPEG